MIAPAMETRVPMNFASVEPRFMLMTSILEPEKVSQMLVLIG